MKEIIIFPVVAILILGFVPQLITVAESSQEKALIFADDMNNAIDCATRAIPLEICSPNLMNHDFTPEMEDTININQDILDYIQLFKENSIGEDLPEDTQYQFNITDDMIIFT